MRDIRRKTRRRFCAEEKIRIVLDGLRGEIYECAAQIFDYAGPRPDLGPTTAEA